MNKFYLTSAIPYVNAAPHIGHALEFVQADVTTRYHREVLKEETAYLTGSDENSLKNVQAAEKAGISAQELCDKNTLKFKDLLEKLNITVDFYQRGSEKKTHFIGSQHLWNLVKNSKDSTVEKPIIYKSKYKGLYCVGCEAFYTEDELVEGKCPEHLKEPEVVEEENYFFRLSFYEEKLKELITSDQLKIIPEFRKNEVLSFLNSGLKDFSISRSKTRAKNWGVPVPEDESQIMYVWFDALNIYQTGIGFGWDESLYQKWWPAQVHIIGKGIIRFHAVYWPAILLAAGLKLPECIFAHGYLTVEGQKMSKSLGNVIDPLSVIEKYGTDPVRYYLLREIPAYSDGDFSESRFKELYNADLANGLGNLVSRIAKLCQNNDVEGVKDISLQLPQVYHSSLQNFRYDLTLEEIWKILKELDAELDQDKPWSLEKDQVREKLKSYAQKVVAVAIALQPFLPETAEKILTQYTTEKIIAQQPLFPRLEK